MAVNSEIYVDKTDLIQQVNPLINTGQRYISVSRPRRFGKSMTADMLCAYYDRGAQDTARALFTGRKLSQCASVEAAGKRIEWDTYLGKFEVLRIVLTDFLGGSNCVDDVLRNLTEEVIAELKDAYPDIRYGEKANLRTAMSRICDRTKRQFVIVIDEWDAIFRVWKDDSEGQEKYLDFLRDWLKDKTYVALAYMTGILPIRKYGEHSALNMFTEYSMMSPRKLARYTGFTEGEVRSLCDEYQMRYEDISSWYDGYIVSDEIPIRDREAYRAGSYKEHKLSIYSPLSVVEAMTTGVIKNYWNKTETYEALAAYIRKDYDGLQEAVALLMNGGRLQIDTATYQNDMTTFHGRDDILSLLIHLGYLGYDDETSEVFIPNREIMDEFKASTKSEEWIDTFRSFEISQELLQATWDADEKKGRTNRLF